MNRVAVATTRTWSRHLDYRRRRETVPPTVAIATANPEDSIIARAASHIVPILPTNECTFSRYGVSDIQGEKGYVHAYVKPWNDVKAANLYECAEQNIQGKERVAMSVPPRGATGNCSLLRAKLITDIRMMQATGPRDKPGYEHPIVTSSR
ncbi:unnamed protein product [Heligmosomoides polygyrus]|uniref:RRM domain-containing protein n=1 Tax=Heligmosomoides polygyrus TaxID=6339 RepID=A0A183F455_HELPZ|nr:unnamed protein product [Heligmosomoides polygyrus]